MAVTTHTSLPSSHQAGDTLSLLITDSTYSAATWTMHFMLSAGGNTYKLTGTASGTDHSFTESSAVTGKWKPGQFVFQQYVENTNGERVTIGNGSFKVLPNIAQQDPDADAWREIHKFATEAITRLAKERVVSYSVAGQSFTLTSVDEALRLERVAKKRVADLDREAKMAAGLGSRRRISFRI